MIKLENDLSFHFSTEKRMNFTTFLILSRAFHHINFTRWEQQQHEFEWATKSREGMCARQHLLCCIIHCKEFSQFLVAVTSELWNDFHVSTTTEKLELTCWELRAFFAVQKILTRFSFLSNLISLNSASSWGRKTDEEGGKFVKNYVIAVAIFEMFRPWVCRRSKLERIWASRMNSVLSSICIRFAGTNRNFLRVDLWQVK